ncbi:DNA N-6-adenine-methyltransferase [Methylobacter psychrophilus]|uniref:DNA N-6-adenine-methyltransferase n=1 Tax=Methylobacter psychrophilus TaxID=96941 RepID=UPI0021D4D53C|nr:DNA N-6-adenine-methyltransferase [Methylobacter psychrophilus]
MKILINSEFKALIPPLSQEEYNQLEKNILADGCREPLVVFNNTLVDGHNRYEICTKHGLPFSTVKKDFADSLSAKLWMIENQAGRRNLTDGWKYQLMQSKKEILLEVGKVKHAENGGDKIGDKIAELSIVDNAAPKHNTRDTIANELGWSTGKVAMADRVWKDATVEIKEQVLSGEVSIYEAYKAVKSGNTHVSNNSGENEWYTPERFIEAARLTMGQIDLDPASSDTAQKVVQATTYYTKNDNGLDYDWAGNIWLNPPYSSPDTYLFVDKLLESNAHQWIVLTNNSSDTLWFHRLLKMCDSVCFTKGRIAFENGDAVMATRQGQTFFYKGCEKAKFENEFRKYGEICIRSPSKV